MRGMPPRIGPFEQQAHLRWEVFCRVKQTDNLNLNLPEYTDAVDIEELNDNFKTIDESIPQPSTSEPLADGEAGVGVSMAYARGDHVHPSDATRQAKITASGVLRGDGNGGVASAEAGADYMAPVVVTAEDNGKFLRVVDGSWAAVAVDSASGVSF